MQKGIVFLIICFLLSGCGSSVISYEPYVFKMTDRAKQGKFIKSNNNNRSNKFAIILPDHFDNVDWQTSPIAELLKKKKYQIIIPQLYGEDEFEVLNFNSKQQRLLNYYFTVNDLINQGITDSSSHIIVIGIGEGSYLVPEAINKTPIDQFFMINSGLHSFRRELEYKMEEGSLGFIQEPLMQTLGARNYKQMKLALGQLNVADDYSQSLGNKTNQDWNSYYKDPTFSEFYKISIPGFILLSNGYPFISTSGKQEIEYSLKGHPKAELIQSHRLEGKGDFQKRTEAERLANKLAELID